MRAPIVVLNAALQPVADLGAVIEVGYTQHLRELWTATFTLRADDPKRVHCRPFAFVRLFDGGNEVGLFRIAPQRARRGGDRTTIEYQCEHALACLADDMMVGPHNVTPPSSALRDAITYILSRQTTARWTLDRLDFTRTWWHYWEDRTLLEALHHALELIPGEWMLTFDTSVSPWRLNVVAVPTAVEAYLDAGRNLEAVERDEDPRGVVTRLYAYGHGIGADQINVRSVNPTGQEFIDAATIGEFGVIARVWEDQRFTTPAGLFEGANARLARLSRPPVTYTVGALDLSRITGLSTDRLVLGRRIRIVDEEMGVNHVERISQIRKHDVIGDPDAADIVIGERHEFPDYGDIAYADDLDGVRDGGSFGRVLSTQIEAGRIKLSAVPGGTVGAFPTPPNIAGLYVGASHFGFHNGAAWTTFMDAAGRFRLVSTGGSLTFDPTLTPPLLELRGRMTIEPGSTGFTNLTDTPVGLIRSYFQTAPPAPAVVALTAGDLWFDTDAGNRAHRWSGTAWVDAQDSGIPQAILAASNAQATADGKVRTYFQAPPAPTTGLSVGDLWVNTADHNRLHRWNGTAWVVFTGAVASLNVVGTAFIADLAVVTAKIADLNVTTGKIADLAVNTAKIADLNVTTGKIADLAVTEAKIGSLAVTEAKIGSAAVTEAKIGLLAVTTARIADAAITEAKIGLLAVTTGRIADAAITSAKIGDLQVTAAKIAALAVTEAKIADLAVTSAKIASAAITEAKIGSLAVTTGRIADAAITEAKIGLLAVTTGRIADAAITTAKIGDLQVTTAKITSLTFDKLVAGTNTASLTIGSGGEIRSANFVSGSAGFRILGTGAAEFNAVTVRGAVITGAGSVINADHMTTGVITARDIRTGTGAAQLRIMAGTHTLSILNTAGHSTLFLGTGRVTLFGPTGSGEIDLQSTESNAAGARLFFYGAGLIESQTLLTIRRAVLVETTGRFTFSGATVFNALPPAAWTDLNLAGTVGARRALVLLRINSTVTNNYNFRSSDTAVSQHIHADSFPGVFSTRVDGATGANYVWAPCNASGVCQWRAEVTGTATSIMLVAFIT